MAISNASEELFTFPEDEGRHGECSEEWWYLHSHLTTDTGKRFAFVLCYIISGFKFWILTDLDRARFDSRIWDPDDSPIVAGTGRLELKHDGSFWRSTGDEFSYRIHEELESPWNGAVDLDLISNKGAVPMWGGRIKMGRDGQTAWYAHTRVDISGGISDGDSRYRVEGTGWIDRQWGNWNRMGFGGWKWFSFHLEDGGEIAAYQQYEPISGRPMFNLCQTVSPDGRVSVSGEAEVYDLGSWLSPEDEVYSSGWQVRCGELGLEMEVRPRFTGQELYKGLWEGACTAKVDLDGRILGGTGFTELNKGRPAPTWVKYLSYLKAIGTGTMKRTRREARMG